MVTIEYGPLVQAVVDAWRARLPKKNDGRLLQIGEADLRQLISQLCRAIDVLTEAMDPGVLLERLRGHDPGTGDQGKR